MRGYSIHFRERRRERSGAGWAPPAVEAAPRSPHLTLHFHRAALQIPQSLRFVETPVHLPGPAAFHSPPPSSCRRRLSSQRRRCLLPARPPRAARPREPLARHAAPPLPLHFCPRRSNESGRSAGLALRPADSRAPAAGGAADHTPPFDHAPLVTPSPFGHASIRLATPPSAAPSAAAAHTRVRGYGVGGQGKAGGMAVGRGLLRGLPPSRAIAGAGGASRHPGIKRFLIGFIFILHLHHCQPFGAFCRKLPDGADYS